MCKVGKVVKSRCQWCGDFYRDGQPLGPVIVPIDAKSEVAFYRPVYMRPHQPGHYELKGIGVFYWTGYSWRDADGRIIKPSSIQAWRGNRK